ncbi:MAG: DUF2848 family protein [Atribacterota bacterium]
MLNFIINRLTGNEEIEISIPFMINAGYAGRTQDKIQEHIEELKKLGVPGPDEIPILFPITANKATQSEHIDVQGEQTSGEIEFVLLKHRNEWLVTVGSDHTDRELEKFSVEKSKQACPNILAKILWPVNEMLNHWDQVQLRSWVIENKERILYQEATLEELLPFKKLLEFVQKKVKGKLEDIPIFSGTIPTLKGLIFADYFEMEIVDPVLDRSIRHQYSVQPLTKFIL